jgi:hypothetical protein
MLSRVGRHALLRWAARSMGVISWSAVSREFITRPSIGARGIAFPWIGASTNVLKGPELAVLRGDQRNPARSEEMRLERPPGLPWEDAPDHLLGIIATSAGHQ